MKILRLVRKPVQFVFNLIILILQLFIRYMVIGIFFLAGLYYTLSLLTKMSTDTTAITNSAFAIFGSLAALSFAWSRSLEAEADQRKRITHAGERFLHAALCVLTASILKYAALAVVGDATPGGQGTGAQALRLGAGVSVSGLFAAALTFAHNGVVVLNRLLWQRAHDYPEYDSLA